jgi:hypothetical protein
VRPPLNGYIVRLTTMTTWKRLVFFGFLAGTTLAGTDVQARRRAPKEVAPVAAAGIKYKVPHFGAFHGQTQNGGYVQAWDLKSKKLLWDRMVYRVVYQPNRETDVQDVFIVQLRINHGRLFVKTERGHKFEMDLSSGHVRALTGLGPNIELPPAISGP